VTCLQDTLLAMDALRRFRRGTSADNTPPFSVWVAWAGDCPQEFHFATRAEYDAFLLGLDQASSWRGYEVFKCQADANDYVYGVDGWDKEAYIQCLRHRLEGGSL